MKLRWLLLLGLVCACKGKPKAGTPGSGSGSGGSAVIVDAAVEVDAASAVAPPAGVLKIDDASDDALTALVFDGKVPVLPAVSHDGAWFVDWYSGYGAPGMVNPVAVWFRAIDGKGKDEIVAITPPDEIADGLDPEALDKIPAAKIAKWRGQAAALSKRLATFESLEAFDAAKLGVEADAKENDDETVVLTLTRQGKRVRRAHIEGYTQRSEATMCNFIPTPPDFYGDQAKRHVYARVMFKWRDDCGMPIPAVTAWPIAGEDPALDAPLAKDAVVIAGSSVGPASARPEPERFEVVETAADGKSAWASFVAKDGARASYVFAQVPDGSWQVVALTATSAVANKAANADAKAGKRKAPPAFTAPPGDEGLRAAFAKLATDGMPARPRATLVAFGSGPDERTTTADTLAKGWNAGWKGKATITSSIARVLPSGTTGWVAANVDLAKTGYKIPFHLFAVFDKAASGEWALVHLHFSIAR